MAAPDRVRNIRVAALAGVTAAAMLGLAYASVPLYRLFCQVTGFAGTTQIAAAAPDQTSERRIAIRFDANTAGSLGWNFHTGQLEMKVKLGEQAIAHYRATNTTDRQLTGSAVYNVTPANAGIYFNKIQCFCFTEQTLKPGESVDMPVVFFVDPAIAEDPDASSIDTITLSYTFYPVDKSKSASAAAPSAGTHAN
jgi:cytochrome c oxidase assembly protein subunit 11